MSHALAVTHSAIVSRTSPATRLRDAWDLPLSTVSRSAALAYERAVLGLLAHRADTAAQLEAALAADAGFALPLLMRGFGLRLLARADCVVDARSALEKVEGSFVERGATLREALLADALRAWLAGDVDSAVASLARSSEMHPTCLVSVKLLHALCFLHGKHQLMRRSLARTLETLPPELPGYGYVLGCHAFALEEAGAYDEAQRQAQAAIALNADDAWGYHALLHVMTMRGHTSEGLAFVRRRAQRFDGGNNFVAHIAWHHALFAIAEGGYEEALALYDGEIIAPLGRDYRDLANCASLLYRLARLGVDVGSRWERLADLAEARSGDHLLGFADAHYLLAMLGAERPQAAERFVASMRSALSARIDHDGLVGRCVGIPLCEGMLARSLGTPDRALMLWLPVATRLQRLGGSHAQRQLFDMMALDAALETKRDTLVAQRR